MNLLSHAFALKKVIPGMLQVFRSKSGSNSVLTTRRQPQSKQTLGVSGLLLRVRRGIAPKHIADETPDALAEQVVPFAPSGIVYN